MVLPRYLQIKRDLLDTEGDRAIPSSHRHATARVLQFGACVSQSRAHDTHLVLCWSAMNLLAEVYRPPLALLTDLYQLTMAQAYRQAGKGEVQGVFHLFFRNSPFAGGFAVACGLSRVLDFVEGFRFGDEELAYLALQTGNDGEPPFVPSFLEELRSLRLECDVDAIPEGTVVFPFEPLVRVRGPLMQAQRLETALLNSVHFDTL